MANVFDYLDWRGDLTLDLVPLCDVDAVVLSRLSYLPLDGLVPPEYGSLIVTGIFAHMALQVFLNVGVVTNLIPTTGITLPFISYGGTAILFLSIEMGIALSVSKQIKIEQ